MCVWIFLFFSPQELFFFLKHDFTGVTFCTASCILKSFLCVLSLLPWIIEYIVLYHPSPWGFVGLTYHFISVWGQIFIPHKRFFFGGSGIFLSLELLFFSWSKASRKLMETAWNVFCPASSRFLSDLFTVGASRNRTEWTKFLLCFYFSHQNQRITVTPSEFLNAASQRDAAGSFFTFFIFSSPGAPPFHLIP